MITIRTLEQSNIKNIVDWCKNKDANFLTQWAGRGYSYPLNELQILNRQNNGANIYECDLDGNMIGTIEIFDVNTSDNSAVVGRFVIDPSLTGKGLGTQIIGAMKEYSKQELALKKLSLRVFDFNKSAYRCYEKNGFTETNSEVYPSGWKCISMEVIL